MQGLPCVARRIRKPARQVNSHHRPPIGNHEGTKMKRTVSGYFPKLMPTGGRRGHREKPPLCVLRDFVVKKAGMDDTPKDFADALKAGGLDEFFSGCKGPHRREYVKWIG